MIHYQLRCGQDHTFDGWFKTSAAFDQQAERGFLACPVCADPKVTRALMAPAVRTGRRLAHQAVAAAEAMPAPGPAAAGGAVAVPEGAGMAVAGGPMPDQVRAFLQRMRAEIERKCDYVGPDFAAQARRIHDGEAPARPIYGETSPEQAEKLIEDGIEVARIPWVPRADS